MLRSRNVTVEHVVMPRWHEQMLGARDLVAQVAPSVNAERYVATRKLPAELKSQSVSEGGITLGAKACSWAA